MRVLAYWQNRQNVPEELNTTISMKVTLLGTVLPGRTHPVDNCNKKLINPEGRKLICWEKEGKARSTGTYMWLDYVYVANQVENSRSQSMGSFPGIGVLI